MPLSACNCVAGMRPRALGRCRRQRTRRTRCALSAAVAAARPRATSAAACDSSDGSFGRPCQGSRPIDAGILGRRHDCARLIAGFAGVRRLVTGAETLSMLILGGGDDYEILFTASRDHEAQLRAWAATAGTPVTRIGIIDGDTRSAPADKRWRSAARAGRLGAFLINRRGRFDAHHGFCTRICVLFEELCPGTPCAMTFLWPHP